MGKQDVEICAQKMLAAADMYEALEALVAIHEFCDETGYVEGEGFVDLEAAFNKARAALARADGHTTHTEPRA